MKTILTKGILLKHYKRKEIQELIVAEAQDKEVGVRFLNGGYGKRPDVLHYPKDILEFAKRGVSSFHCSEENWHNPLELGPSLKRSELDANRAGWDLILDIDCKHLEYSKIAADIIVSALKHHDINSYSVKFSGNHGFHIGVPFKAFPQEVNDQPTSHLFPEGPKKIAAYLKGMIREHLAERLLNENPITTIAKNTGQQASDLLKGRFDPFSVVDIDTVLISSRHLYRMPYSFNEKSGLVSIPIKPNRIMNFDLSSAKYTDIPVGDKFIKIHAKPNEALHLFVQAFDFKIEEDPVIEPAKVKREFKGSETAVPEQYFPPCIKNISAGIQDGKKRALFALINFLSSAGWQYEDIEEYCYKWNEKNPEPLREVYLKGQLRYAKMHKKVVLPPNCANHAYWKDLQVCTPDGFCKRIKNPANYAIFKQKIAAENAPKKRGRKKKQAENKESKQKDEPKNPLK